MRHAHRCRQRGADGHRHRLTLAAPPGRGGPPPPTGRSPASPPACRRASCSTPTAPDADASVPAETLLPHPPHRRVPGAGRERHQRGAHLHRLRPAGGAQTVTATAQDADANRAAGDRGTLAFQVPARANPTVASNPAPLAGADPDGAALTATLPKGPSWADGGSVRRIRALAASNPAPLAGADPDGAALTATLPKGPSWADGGSVRRIRALAASNPAPLAGADPDGAALTATLPKGPSWTG